MPEWKLKINLRYVFNNEDMTFEERRDNIIKTICNTTWPATNYYVNDLLDELSGCLNVEEFDSVWDAIYDEADIDRVWLATI